MIQNQRLNSSLKWKEQLACDVNSMKQGRGSENNLESGGQRNYPLKVVLLLLLLLRRFLEVIMRPNV